MIQNGISLGDLQDYGWTGSHGETANSVTKGGYDVVGTRGLLFWNFKPNGRDSTGLIKWARNLGSIGNSNEEPSK